MHAMTMEGFDPEGMVETSAMELLEARGWSVTGSKRNGLDADVDVAFQGTRGRLRFRSPFEAPPGSSQALEPAPAFVRLDMGEPDGEPERWAVWDLYQFPHMKETPSYVAFVFHEALGTGWASLACSSVSSHSWFNVSAILSTFLQRAEYLSPGRDEAERRKSIFDVQRRNFSAQRRKGRLVVGAAVTLALGALFAYFPLHIANTVEVVDGAAVGGMAVSGLIGAVLLVVSFFTALPLLRQPSKPVEGMKEIAGAMKSSGAFEAFVLTRAKKRDGLPVVVRRSGIVDEDAAPLIVSRLSATSPNHGVTLEADLCQIAWPEGTSKGDRFVPDRWLTLDLLGDASALSKIPSGPREERAADRLRWSLTGPDLDQRALADLFQSVAAALSPSGPYR